jgi:hypothetical protein
MKKFTPIAAVAAGLLAMAPDAFAQGCAMCYANAAAQGPRAARQLDYAILTLLIPCLLLFGGVLFTAVRRSEWEADGGEEACPEAARASAFRKVLPGTR